MAEQPVVPGLCHRVGLCALAAMLLMGGPLALGQGPALGFPQSQPPGPPGLALQPVRPPLPVPAEEMVVEVRVEGNRVVKLEKILPHIHTRAGRPYDPEQIEKDVRELNRTRLFVTVRPLSQPVPGGRLVIFQVVERPVLKQVIMLGNTSYTTNALRKEADLKAGSAADPFAVEEGKNKIVKYYQDHGYSLVRVTVIEGNKTGDLRAVYLIDEGPKQKIYWVNFVGNTIVSGQRLYTQIKSHHPYFWLFKGEVDRKLIAEDVELLTAYYRGLGFFRARVGRELEFNEKQDWLTLTFVIDEGPRYAIRNVAFIGNTKFSNDQLMEKLKLKGGRPFNQSEMLGDVAAIKDKYGSKGYVFADVQADNRFLDQPGQLDLVYNVKEGDRYRVGRITVEIKGENPHTRITTAMNRLSLIPGDIVDLRKLRDDERRLKASGLYLVEPGKGSVPKIVYSPPDSEGKDKEEIANRPGRQTSYYRGPEPGAWSEPGTARPLPPLPLGERYLDVVLQYDTPDDLQQDLGAPPPDGPIKPMEAPTVVRGQYTGEGGWSVPQIQSQPPAPAAQPPAPAYNYQPVQPAAPGYNYQPVAPSGQAYQPAPGYAAPAGQPPTAANGNQYAAPSYPPRWPAPSQQPPSDRLFGDPTPYMIPGPTGEPLRDLELTVRAEESRTGRLMFGVGVNSEAGLVGNITLDEENFDWTRPPTCWEDIRNGVAWRGAGQRFRIEAVPGTEVQRYMVSFEEPYLMDTAVSLGLSAFYYDRVYTEWTENRTGGRISLGYQFTHDLTGTIAFRGMNVHISNPEYPVPSLLAVLGNNSLYGFSVQLAHDTRDNYFLPTEGHRIQVAFEEVTGSYTFPHSEIDASQFFKLYERADGSGRHVLSLSARMGVSGDNTPIYERYFAGGFSTLRGFYFRGVSPRDPKYGMAVGGDYELLLSAQYLFPITADDMLRGVLFVDAGTVEPSIKDWSDNFRVAPGFGLRIVVPMMGPAPIALDFAFPVASQPGDQRQMFSFFVGFNR